MRISDWSSDVCSSDLTKFGTVRLQCSPLDNRQECIPPSVRPNSDEEVIVTYFRYAGKGSDNVLIGREPFILLEMRTAGDRKSVESGQSVSVRVDLGGRRIIQQKKHQ